MADEYVPLFSAELPRAPRKASRKGGSRSVERSACSHCRADSVGLVRSPDGTHLTWRVHTLQTVVGTSLPCQASGQRLCDAPARPIPGVTPPHCPHRSRS